MSTHEISSIYPKLGPNTRQWEQQQTMKYCKFGNLRENFIFGNSVKRPMCDVNIREYGMIYFHQ